uniref:CSON008023 protein n=1 Tax=Culicoides sonorensis TaxID=179676 RepID=A0A336MW23_CULSO
MESKSILTVLLVQIILLSISVQSHPVPEIACIVNCGSSSAQFHDGVKRTNETNIYVKDFDTGAGLLGADLNYESATNELRNKQTVQIGDNFESIETKRKQKEKQGGFSLFGFSLFNFGSKKNEASSDHIKTYGV